MIQGSHTLICFQQNDQETFVESALMTCKYMTRRGLYVVILTPSFKSIQIQLYVGFLRLRLTQDVTKF